MVPVRNRGRSAPPTAMLPRGLAAGLAALFLVASPASAQGLLPADFLDFIPQAGAGPAEVEADLLSYDARKDQISASGGVVMRYQGYVIEAGRLTYNQQTGALLAEGHVRMIDPGGNIFEAESIEVTGGMKQAILRSMTITTSDGAQVTAADVEYSDGLKSILTDAAYSPCGLCVDEKGRRIGWRVKAAKMIYDVDKASVVMEQPALELLGVQVAWLPWFWFPDPTQPRKQGIRMPSIDYSTERGVGLTIPYFVPAGEDTDLLFSPKLLSRQGVLFDAEVTHRFGDVGEINVSASGLYQLDPSAFAGTVGARDWRGAVQSWGKFSISDNWTAGYSYSAFTDSAYLSDYGYVDEGSSVTDQIWSTYLDPDAYVDARVERFRSIDDFATEAAADANNNQQGMALPWVRVNAVRDLAPGSGRFNFSAEVLGVVRLADQTDAFGPGYVFGFEGNKAHVTAEGAWENQYLLPGGVTVTPYLGARLDAAGYDGASSDPSAPPATWLVTATPIASMDFRWPLMAQNGGDTYLIEPVAQLVYRGSSTTDVGITNDNAQSFVFDEANLFSSNRFSGSDRQQTGLVANVGVHYQANFANGGWLDLIGGQSIHLAGLNAYGVPDAAQVGTSTCLNTTISCYVAGARFGYGALSGAAKFQIDPSSGVRRAGLGGMYSADGYVASVGYQFIKADPLLGVTDDEHEISGDLTVPIIDYWSLNGGLDYDIFGATWTAARGGVTYNDGYLTYGLNANATPTSFGFGVTFNLLGPAGEPAL
ncbi:MAG: LPS assembly protein LptD [Devosia sp.]